MANSTCSGEELNSKLLHLLDSGINATIESWALYRFPEADKRNVAFGGLVASICQNLNVTSNGTATATATGSRPTGSIVPVSQGINRWGIECGLAPIVGVVAVVSGLAWVL